MAYHYAFMMKVATVREPKTFSKAAKDPRWVDAMNVKIGGHVFIIIYVDDLVIGGQHLIEIEHIKKLLTS